MGASTSTRHGRWEAGLVSGRRGARRAARAALVRGVGVRLRSASAWLGVALAACAPEVAHGEACRVAAGELVFTEVFADPLGPDAGREWIEVYNATAAPVELAGLSLRHSREDGSRAKVHVLRPFVLGAGEYLALGNAPPELAPPYVGYGYGVELGELQNGARGRLELACGPVVIDEIVYRPVRQSRSLALDGGDAPDAVANDEPGRWCDTSAREVEPGAFGSPGAPNEDCEVVLPGRCVEAGQWRDTVAPAPGDLVITELLPNPDATADALGEWLELAVARPLDLNGVLVDRVGDPAAAQPIAAEACLRVGPGLAVLARSADPAVNGGLPLVAAPLPLALVGGSTQAPGDVHLFLGERLLDGVRWRRSTAGKALQLDPAYIDATANDDERVFCDAQVPYGAGDRGSPGGANVRCAIAPAPGMCDDAGRMRSIVAPVPGQLVITELMPSPAGTDSEREWLEVQNVGTTALDLNGLGVDRLDDSAPAARLVAAACLSVPPGGRAVLARHADTARNGGLPAPAAVYPLALGAEGALQLVGGDEPLDVVTWQAAPAAAALQLDPAYATAAGNDRAEAWCAAAAPYGTGDNLGTPGGSNRPCP